MLNFVTVEKKNKEKSDTQDAVNKCIDEAVKAKTPKRGTYKKYTPEDRFEIRTLFLRIFTIL